MTNQSRPVSDRVGIDSNLENGASSTFPWLDYECASDELWLPGMSLDKDFPEATPKELCEAWKVYDGREAISVDGVLGVYVPPDKPPTAVASVDLCEVLRETHQALDLVTGHEGVRRGHYSGFRWFDGTNGNEDSKRFDFAIKNAIFQTVMSNALVPPVQDIETIKLLMMRWRAEGVYIVANTSTLKGCEVGTIARQLKTYLPDCFDGIVFPRNHFGDESDMTKARALNLVTDQAGINAHALPLVHIDDTVHHNDTMLSHFSDHPNVTVVIPRHADNGHGGAEYLVDTPLQAFQRADTFFNSQEVS